MRSLITALFLAGTSLHAQSPLGTWELTSRTDSSAAGIQPSDGPLGSDPIAWISYDTRGHVQAQLMARDRAKAERAAKPTTADPNNSAASGGYDAYFGTYVIDAKAGTVTHHLTGALSAADVGRTLTRHFERRGEEMVIWFEARRTDEAVVIRRLKWRRISP